MLLAQTCHVSEISLPPRPSLRVRFEVVWQGGELEGVVGENCSSPEVKPECGRPLAGQSNTLQHWVIVYGRNGGGSCFGEFRVLCEGLERAECLKSDSSAEVGFGARRGLSSNSEREEERMDLRTPVL